MDQTIAQECLRIPPVGLAGDLMVPRDATGIVLFAHGSGSSRHSRRNRYVAGVLQQGGVGTLLLDLLTTAEEEVDLRTRHLRFDIDLLAGRLRDATDWLRESTRRLPMAYFGASTGGGAALVAAAEKPEDVCTVVSRGGRPDLAGAALERVKAPTLLIVGGEDHEVVERNRSAMTELRCEKEMSIVPGATHSFEEPGALEQVAKLALGWFGRHFGPEAKQVDASGGELQANACSYKDFR